ncbi:hypothetical protein PGTUg99_000378 [Puccinia graminis f. sp. tritici]|uniref:Uncharacterized protein n=1 Tax=Puccinia graminis f. sp. tritici TaxID=56615 RepID=A0A5B0MSU1_PUCGR|nr:hypothetical protein PGTUg99_000378 [Puccinia graminis f. sp. tritici]
MAPEPKDPWPRGKTPRPTQPRKLHRFQFCPKLGPLNQYSTQNNHRGATTLNHTSNHTSTQPIHNRTHFLPGNQPTSKNCSYTQRLINCLPNSAINNIRLKKGLNWPLSPALIGCTTVLAIGATMDAGTKATDLRPHSRSADQRTRYDSPSH